jgi:hypothetical protein
MGDEQDKAEALDDEVFDADADINPDYSAENDLDNYPGDGYLGVTQHGITELEAHIPESDEERSAREEPDPIVLELNAEAIRSENEDRFARSRTTNSSC